MGENINTQDSDLLKEKRKVDCLLECLLFLSKYHQRAVSKEALAYGLGIHGEVLNQSNFISSAKKIGLISKPSQRANIKDIDRLALPAVIYTQNNCAAVLLDYDEQSNSATAIFPEISQGETKVSLDELEKRYTGKCIIIKPAYNFENRVSKGVKIEQPKKWFWGAMKRNKDLYIKVIIASIFINIFVIATPLFIMNVYDRILPNNAIETLWALAIGIFVVMTFDFILKIIRSKYLAKASKKADIIMSNKIFDQLLNIRLDQRPASTGMFVNRLQSFQAIRDFFGTATIATIVDIPFLFIFIAIIFYIGGPLGWITVATLVIAILFSLIMQKPIQKYVKQSSKEEQLKHTTLNETVSGLEIIKSVRGQNRMKAHWDKSIGQTVYFNEQSQELSQITSYFTSFISQLSNIFIIIGGVYLASTGDLTMGGIVAAMLLNRRAISPVSQIVNMVLRYDKTVLALDNIDKIMQMEVERENKVYLSRPDLKGEIEFKDITFSYKDKNYEVLKNINLKIKQGEKIAILGRIGSGKSTLVKLLQNLYVPKKGSILIEKTDVRQIDPVDLRRSIGVVPQEPFLFMGSVKDNITIGEPFATDEEILKASKIAGVHEFLGKHESGYDFMLGERGEGLSGGEIQSITLARALVSNPDIMILDEPTNSMDKQTEKQFINKLHNILDDQTVIVVTHKTSMLALVDRIIVLDDGKIIADGPKEKIIASKKESNEK
ncbi:type I secretion system permease/ATPase [Arcobacter roscoffensis]|uniref:Type I secretion system permease/ATPase n=1 Tax=Arcobacter roscoffensis TaxID=2961520 RepID=A0ABY5E849_9BACT|nr:type I secretion system permease/ATPase [Arcobacter roscoffensis]UTJ06926.1 type I secretion system permease/ATPase [Arcobacter roscoffensis]